MDKKKLEAWTEKALDYYNEMAQETKLDLSFYQFQKPADFNNECELLLVGLNPGAGKGWGYASQYNNPNWQPCFEGKRMTMEGFLKGNLPAWENSWKSGSWNLLKGLSLIGLGKERLDGIGNWQYINYVPFATNKFNVFRQKAKGTDAFSRCIELTEEYIRGLGPKRIIIMGTANGVDKLRRGKDTVLLRGRIRYIIKTTICDIPAFAIPHPSYANWPVGAREEMSRMIGMYLDGRVDDIGEVILSR